MYTARNCTQAGLIRGCCESVSNSSCYVSGGHCYCDRLCVIYNDCCPDVLISHCGEI